MIRTETADSLSPRLRKLLAAVELYCRGDSRSNAIQELDRIIGVLSNLRNALLDDSRRERNLAAVESINQVLRFLDSAKSDSSFQLVLSDILRSSGRSTRRRPKPEPAQIEPNLTNQKIRELLERNPSKAELIQIANQRSIAVGKRTLDELRAAILSFIDRQESYDHLRR